MPMVLFILQVEEVMHLDAAELGDAAEVVAEKVDDDQVLGAVLGRPGELGHSPGLRTRSTGPGTGAQHRIQLR